MEIAKMLNTTILACLLILTGCLGLFDDDDVIDDAEGGTTTTAAGTAPAVQLTQASFPEPVPVYNSSTGELVSYSGHIFAVYWAMMDVDGSIASAGFDIDLDGTIDVSVTTAKGVTNLSIPTSQWVSTSSVTPSNSALITTVAFIATDDDSLSTVQMMTVSTGDLYFGPSMYVLSTADHADDVEDDAGLMTLTFGNGGDLDWALVQIEIIKDSVPVTCDNPDLTGGNCGASQHGGADGTSWEKGETIILSSTGGAFCDADCTLTVRIKYNGDVVMSAAVHMI
jgi:hypothetical protein